MNPLLEQFLSESRELIGRSSDAFLTLEKDTTNEATLNELFRYVHTIKGGSGLFDIEPFTHLVHVAEDSLSQARSGDIVLNADCIDVYLKVLDQLTDWLAALEDNETLPHSAVFESKRLIKTLQEVVLGGAVDGCNSELSGGSGDDQSLTFEQLMAEAGLTDASTSLLDELAEQVDRLTVPALLVAYTPEENAFFSGDDPISTWLQLPGMVWQKIEDQVSTDHLETYDPYLCRLRLFGLSTAPIEAVQQSLSYVLPNTLILPVRVKADNTGWVRQPEPLASVPSLIARAQLRLLKQNRDSAFCEASLRSAFTVLGNLQTKAGCFPSLVIPESSESYAVNEFSAALEAELDQIRSDTCAAISSQHLGAGLPSDQSEPVSRPEPSSTQSISDREEKIRTVKVDQERLEQLVDLTGELIVAKNSMQHLARRVEEEYGIKQLSRELKSEHAVLNRISESLQDVVMQIRMIPVSTLFQRFPRLVRDLSRRLGKKIELVIEGEDTEADKNIVEQLADPLIHLVRNSIDHGIETPEKRKSRGKQETGTIRLTARTVEDSVQIEIRDDGNGIDPKQIREKAVEKGVVSYEEAQNLTDQATLHLIFAPGFSTREQVSDLSGRGVGMDVVKTAVTRIGGHIEIDSETGKGSVIRVTLPASITVTRVMMFEMDGQVYGIPVELLTETIKISGNRIRKIKNGEAYVLRKNLIPIYRMARILGLRSNLESTDLSILNLNLNGQTVGMVVDRLLEGVDVIVKPMEGVMARFPIYSGAAVLGDGRVLLVVNPKEIQLCH